MRFFSLCVAFFFLQEMNMHYHQRLYDSEVSPVTPTPSSLSSGRGHYCSSDVEPSPAPIIRGGQYIGDGYYQYQIRHRPFDLPYQIMSEPEPITVHENDVLMGRGGKNNQHSGNEKLRELAREQSANYRESTKKGKSSISRDLVQKMRDMVPPARFLKRNSTSGAWEDVGDDIAREKASQVLRDAVALLPEEAGGVRRHVDDDDEDDVEPIAVRPTAGAAATATTTMPTQVTQDEMDRKPSAAAGIGGRMMMMGPPDDHHRRMPSSISATSSFPPASPVESYSRKRQRYYYQQYPEYVPQHPYHGYHERYPPPPPPPLPHGEGYVPDSPARRRHYDYTTHPRYHPDYRDTSSPPPDYSPPPRADHMMGYPPHPHYHTAPPTSHYHAPHVRGTTTSLDSSPIGSSRARHHESSYPTPVVRRPHSLPGYLPSTQPHPSHRQHNEFLPPAPPPTAGGRMPYSPPPAGGRMPYSPQRPTSMGADEPPPPPPYGVHHHLYSGPQQRHYHHQPPPSHPGSPMVRRPLPAGDDNRQASSASAQSLLGDVASSTGINDFDLFNGELLASDLESSPRVPPSAYHHRRYQGRPPYPPPVDDGPRRWYQNQQQYDLSLPGISSPQPQSAPEQQPPRGSEPGSPAPEA